jgi:hypothetical protein
MAKQKRVERGDVISFKIPVKCSDKQLELTDQWKRTRLIPTKFFEKVDEEIDKQQELRLFIGRQLTEEEIERLNSPGINEMLGNMCLALLSNQVPTIPIASQPAAQPTTTSKVIEPKQQQFKTEIDPGLDDAIDALIDDDDWD